MRYDVYSPAKKITAHVLLPKGKECKRLLVDEKEESFKPILVGDSSYVDFECEPSKKVSFEILF